MVSSLVMTLLSVLQPIIEIYFQVVGRKEQEEREKEEREKKEREKDGEKEKEKEKEEHEKLSASGLCDSEYFFLFFFFSFLPFLSNPFPPPSLFPFFFSLRPFVQKYRNVLNEIVRKTPGVLEGSLNYLTKYAKFLDFDNKRGYFRKKLDQESG